MKRYSKLKLVASVVCLLTMAFIGFEYFVLKQNVLVEAIIALVLMVTLVVVVLSISRYLDETSKDIENNIDASTKEMMKEGKVGLLVYDANYVITWTSSLFADRSIDYRGEKVLSWLPELQDLLSGQEDERVVVINDDKYMVRKHEEANSLIFKDITREYDLQESLNDNALVIGILSYDNFDEANEDEDDVSYVNTNIKIPVLEYFKKFDIAYRTLRNNRLLLILNEKQFDLLLKDRFSILNKVRSEARKSDLDITLSMSFARGSENINELDEMAQSLLEVAQTRGGDQVAVRKLHQEAVFYGGSSEAIEKQSKVKVRVMTNTIKNLINRSSNVIIVGHNDMDGDCIGSALAMSNIVGSLNKKAYIITKNGGVDPMIKDVLNKYNDVIIKKHNLVSESEALDFLNDDTLVIMIDHHSRLQSNAKEIVDKAKKICIIDHHRRQADLDVKSICVYIEASASSACELVVEMMPYLSKKIVLSSEEANIMYIGLLIDTNHFRVRTGTRTFDVAKILRNFGADPSLCEQLCAEPYDTIIKRTQIINNAKRYKDNMVISSMNNATYNRTQASQACDELVRVKDIEAAFVICKSEKDEVVVTARSKGRVNVSIIMEKMHGGGHMTAAGLQRSDSSVSEVTNELMNVIDGYVLEGEKKDESNSVE